EIAPVTEPAPPPAEAEPPAPDGWITAEVKAELASDDALADNAIEVETADGVVTLGGTASSEATRARALAIARTTRGATRVVDAMTVPAPRCRRRRLSAIDQIAHVRVERLGAVEQEREPPDRDRLAPAQQHRLPDLEPRLSEERAVGRAAVGDLHAVD